MIKYGEKEVRYFMFKVCQKTWHEKQMRSSWKEAIIIPLHKKGDKTDCCNDRDMSLLNIAFKVFSKMLLSRLIPEKCLGKYQCGFHKGKSTVERLSTIGQIIVKKYEHRQDFWQIFVGFRISYDSIHRESSYNIME